MTGIIRERLQAKLNRCNLPSKRLSADSNWKLKQATQECWQFVSYKVFAVTTRHRAAARSPRRLGTAAGPPQSRFSETARMLMTDARYQAVLRSVRSAILRISLSR